MIIGMIPQARAVVAHRGAKGKSWACSHIENLCFRWETDMGGQSKRSFALDAIIMPHTGWRSILLRIMEVTR